VGVIIGSPNSALEAAGNWSSWKPELSRSRGISSWQTLMRFLMMSDFPAFVYRSKTMEFTFMYRIVLIHSFQAKKFGMSFLFALKDTGAIGCWN